MFVVVRNRKLPVFTCPYGHGMLRVHQARANREFPKGTVFFGCNEAVTQGPETKKCGYNVYPTYKFDKYKQAVVAVGGNVNESPQILEYRNRRLESIP